MKTPLSEPVVPSIYFRDGVRQLLPKRMAKCTPDMHNAIVGVASALRASAGDLILSDMFRSYDMQLQAHLDFKTGKKKAFSPPPGSSMHEAGRAFDLDLSALGRSLDDFWKLAAAHGLSPIITRSDPKLSEAWHFDCRASHVAVYDYYKAGKGKNFESPYAAMAASAIVAIGVHVDAFGNRQSEAAIQFGLVRLGFELGGVDGNVGLRTRQALEAAGIAFGEVEVMLLAIEDLLQQKFPAEYRLPMTFDVAGLSNAGVPKHVLT